LWQHCQGPKKFFVYCNSLRNCNYFISRIYTTWKIASLHLEYAPNPPVKTSSLMGTNVKLVVTGIGLERPTDRRGNGKRPQNLPYDHHLRAESKQRESPGPGRE
jgi:hypothetical protein